MRRVVEVMVLLLMSAMPLRALADEPTPQPSTPNPAWVASPEAIARTRAIVVNTKGTDGVFNVSDDGSVRHVQSGLLCPAKFPNVDFWHAEIFNSPLGQGMDIGCDYGRNGPDGHVVSKLTIFATKAPDGLTLDQAFGQDRGDLLRSAKNAVSHGEAVKIEEKVTDPSQKLPEIRSEEFSIAFDGREYTSQILVAVCNGWVLEIRATFAGKSNEVAMADGATVNDAVLAVGDRTMMPEAFTLVAKSLGK